MDAVLLSTVIAAQVDARFLALDLAHGSRVCWADVAARMAQASGRRWQEPECQRLWRFCAYGEDIGQRAHLLPDSDGEDDPIQGAWAGCPPAQALQACQGLPTVGPPQPLTCHPTPPPQPPHQPPCSLSCAGSLPAVSQPPRGLCAAGRRAWRNGP
jgi:hypothetical protein